MKLIDFHTHIFPDAVEPRAISALIEGVRKEQGEAYVQQHSMVHNIATADGLLDAMRKNGVDMSVCLPIATKPSQTANINHFAETIRNKWLVSFGSLHPMQEDWEAVLENLAARGFRGIKLHHQFQGCDFDSKESIRVLKKAEQLGLYVMFHAGGDIGLPAPVRATPQKIRNVLSEIDGKYLIAAHLGGWKQWNAVEQYLVGTNILFDTAFIKDFLQAEQCRRIIRNHGVSKVLFGTDAPWEAASETLAYLQSLGFSSEEMEQITHRNAERVLGIEENA